VWQFVEGTVWDEQHRISGHYDGTVDLSRVRWAIDNSDVLKANGAHIEQMGKAGPEELAILEIKTVGRFVFEQVTSAQTIPPYYQMQACAYMQMNQIWKTLFWYIERDSGASKCFVLNYEDSWWSLAKTKARIIWEAIRDETLPEAAMACSKKTDARAKKCSHCKSCFETPGAFKTYVQIGKQLGAKSGRVFLDLSGVKFDAAF